MIRTMKSVLVGAAALIVLQQPLVCLAASETAKDPRSIASGHAMPKEGYCDQPYVVINKDGSWLCTMTTGQGREGQQGQHIVATISRDQGKSWSPLIDIEPADGPEASWVTPLILPSGRVFAFYTYNNKNMRTVNDEQGKPGRRVDSLGAFVFKYSGDGGRTWSAKRYEVPIRTTEIDRKNFYHGEVKFFWSICKPIVVGESVFVAIHKVGNFSSKKGFMVTSEGFVFRSDNLLTELDPAKIAWTMLPEGDMGLRSPEGRVADEQNLVSLVDGSLFCMYRTIDGHPCQAYSRDRGLTWTPPAHATYEPGGAKFRHPRACPRIWRTSEGKFLFWFHNNGNRWYNSTPDQPTGSRNVAWLSGGVEKDGFIHWSQPEIVLYEDDWKIGPSYPDLIEQDGKFWITETQKTMARVHEIDRRLLEGMWNQRENKEVAKAGLVLSLEGDSLRTKQTVMPKLPKLSATAGFSLDFTVRFDDLAAGQVLLDWRNSSGKGGVVKTTSAGAIGIELSDGKVKAAWDCDPGLLKTGKTHHVAIIVDGGPRVITFLVDGKVCDGGTGRVYGWGRFDKALGDVNGGTLLLAPALKGQLSLLRVYKRYLRNSEAVGNYQVESVPHTPRDASHHAERGEYNADPRNIAAGYPIPKEGYCDQPYVAVTKDGNWLCLLTTGPGIESQKFQHVVATISNDQGKTWSKLIDIEPGNVPGWRMTSWVIPLVIPSGRVYAFYDYDGERVTKMPSGKSVRPCLMGWYCYRYSDDNGRTWSKERFRLPVRVTDVDRNNEWHGKLQMFWGIDKPIVFNHGRSVIFAFSKLGKYIQDKGEGWFFRSDNILTESDPAKIEWQMLPDGEKGVRNPEFKSVQEEHNVVELGNGDLYCAYRTVMGFPGQSTSKDGGHTWSLPMPMTYGPGGRTIKHNRACPMLWKTAGGKYLFWFHNNGTKDFKGRNPVWITGGIEKDGTIHWSEPEILLYDDDPTILGMSYPDLIEQDGKFWVTETQKTIARVHPVDRTLLEGMWNQRQNKEVAKAGLVLSLEGDALRAKEVTMPRLPTLAGHGFSLDFRVRLDDLSPGQALLDWRNATGKGGVVKTTPEQTIAIELSDGKVKSAWYCDPGLLKSGHTHHVTIIVDGGPRIITLLVDGNLCDGGAHRTYGWSRFDEALDDVNGGRLQLAPALKGQLLLLRIYDRYLRTSEAVGNWNASE